MLDRLRTVALIAIVTLLIWLWAEAESLSTQYLAPGVSFISPENAVAIKVLDPPSAWNGAVRVRVQGATSALDRAQRELAGGLALNPGVGGIPAGPGEHTVDLREALRQSPSFRELGLMVVDTDPRTVRVAIDTYTTIELPVRADIAGLELDGEPLIDPSTATVRLPSAAALRFARDGYITATPDAEALGSLKSDEPQVLRARLSVQAGPGVPASVLPPSAQVTLRIRSTREAFTLKAVPVWVTLPRDEVDKWDVAIIDATVPEVTLSGPRDLVRALRERPDSVIASVTLTSQDLKDAIGAKSVTLVGLPEGVSGSAHGATIRLRVTPKQR
ncbi:MAG: hypothetical protein ACT4PL_02830 [Phycisphaerales bacterium]